MTGWIEQFPELAALPAEDRRLLEDHATTVNLPAGTTVFAPGLMAESFLLLLKGKIRVQQTSASGREIVLYRVGGGETCIMTTACLLANEFYSAEGITETEVTAVAISKEAFEEAIARSSGFRRLVFSQYSHRISDVMHVVEEVAFERLDKRLAARLLELASPEGALSITHQELAAELGTAREVIGRQLKELERRDFVSLSRGTILLKDRKMLECLTSN